MRKIDELGELYLDPDNADKSLLTKEDFKEKKIRYESKKKKILKAIEKISKRQDNILQYFADSVELAKAVVHRFNHGDIETKRKILIDLGRTIVVNNRNLYLEPKLVFAKFREVKELVEMNPEWLELTPANRDKDIQLFEEIRTVWSGERDSNP